MRLIDGVVEAEAVGNLLIGRIPKHGLAAADQHGHVLDGDVKAIQQSLDVAVAFKVDVGVRVAVARQELFDAKRVRGMHRAYERDVPKLVSDQLHPPKDEGPHQNLAELGVGLHERQHMFAIQLDHLARFARPRADQRAPARDHGGFAGELPGSMDDDETLRCAGWPDNLDLTGLHDKERVRLCPGLDEHFSALDRTYPPVRSDPRDLRRGQRRKHVVGAR